MGLEIRRRQGDARLGEGEGLPDDLFRPRRPGGEGGLNQHIGEGAIGAGEFPIQLDRPAEQILRPAVGLRRPADPILLPAQIVVVGLQALGRLAQRPLALRDLETHRYPRDDVAHDLVLQCEKSPQAAVITLAPDVMARGRVDELGIDADLAAQPLHAALHHIAHTQLAGDRGEIGPLVPHREGRMAGDDAEGGKARQIGRQIIGNAVAEILLLGIAAHI